MMLNKAKKCIVLASAIALICVIPCACSLKYTADNVPATSALTAAPTAEPLAESRIIRLTLESVYMGRETPFMIYLPKGYGSQRDYPVFYGLHGYSANEKQWIDTVGAADAADELIESGVIEPLIMVFPLTRYDTIKEIQEDMEDGIIGEAKMDQFLCKELVPYIDSNYNTITSADGRYIGGFSMGGAIALRIAFHHTDMFGKAGGYSPAVPSSDFSDKQFEKWLYPNDDTDMITDVAAFAKEKGLDKLQVYINCGNSNDPFTTGVQSLYEALQKRGIEVQFETFNGGHDVHLIINKLEDHLKFYCGTD